MKRWLMLLLCAVTMCAFTGCQKSETEEAADQMEEAADGAGDTMEEMGDEASDTLDEMTE